MKYIKLIILSCLTLLMGACSNDDNINSGNATLSFKILESSVKESNKIIDIPIVLDGIHDGNVTFDITATSPNGAIEDQNFMITSKKMRMTAGTSVVNVEIKLIDDKIENEDRIVKLKISNPLGATIKSDASEYTLTIVDNDKPTEIDPKIAIVGDWTFTASEGTFDVTIAPSSDEPSTFVCTGLNGEAFNWRIKYNEDDKAFSVETYYVVGTLNFQEIGEGDIVLASVVNGNQLTDDPIEITYNEDISELTLDPEIGLAGAIFEPGTNNFTGKVWFVFNNCVMTKQ